MARTNNNLKVAFERKYDEFYTSMYDINDCLTHCKDFLAGKTIYCNCDNPTFSNFWRYLHENFSELGLKKLISTYYDCKHPVHATVYTGGNDTDITAGEIIPSVGCGDFRNREYSTFLDEADLIVTNPPFSLFGTFLDFLYEKKKDFLVIGNQMAITRNKFFEKFKTGGLYTGFLGHTRMTFLVPHELIENNKRIENEHFVEMGICTWYTTLNIPQRTRREYKHRNNTDHLQQMDNHPGVFYLRTIQEVISNPYIDCMVSKKKIPKLQERYGDDCVVLEDCGKQNKVRLHRPYLAVPINYIYDQRPDMFEMIDILNHDQALGGKNVFSRMIIRLKKSE